MNWDDLEDDDFLEFIKFDDPMEHEDILYDDVKTLYIKPEWETLDSYTNEWNKKRHFIKCKKIKVYPEGHKRDAEVQADISYKLDMGKRLLNAMREHYQKKPRYVKITRVGEGFGTHYYVAEYKIKSQELIIPKKQVGRPKKK